MSSREQKSDSEVIRLCVRGHAYALRAASSRAVAGELVRREFQRCYDARVSTLAPELLELIDESDEPCAVVGLRMAQRGPLFLERYLSAPIEQVLCEKAGGRTIARESICELGNLAVGRARLATPFFQAVMLWLLSRSVEWIAFTGTEPVHHVFRQMGLVPRVLGHADAEALGPSADDWGNYYEHTPRVAAGPVAEGLSALEPALFDAEQIARCTRRLERAS